MLDMPPFVVLIVCKVALTPMTPLEEANAKFTGHQNNEWAVEHGKMVCRRHEIQMYNPDITKGADPTPFNTNRCQRAGIMEGSKWNATHSRYKWWRTACPTPIVDTKTGEVIDWLMPDCGANYGSVICERDTQI